MKYKCDMVKDLMPLCLDESATEVSEQVVIEHMAECKNCEEYYRLLNKEIIAENDISEPEKQKTGLKAFLAQQEVSKTSTQTQQSQSRPLKDALISVSTSEETSSSKTTSTSAVAQIASVNQGR